jgi:predicted DNA-binding ribbon-helix-helix protein
MVALVCSIHRKDINLKKSVGIIMMQTSGILKSLDIEDIDEPRSTLVSRNITVLGRRTSVRLEPEMWTALREIAQREKCRIHDICSLIQKRKNQRTSLTAAIRVFLMLYYRAASTEEGHARVGHGNFNTMLNRARLSPDQLLGVAQIGPDRQDSYVSIVGTQQSSAN